MSTSGSQTQKVRKSKGAGDTIKKIMDRLGIPQCGGCKERQEILNRLIPYQKGTKIKQ